MKRFADAINQQLITEARLVAQTRIDFDAFLALPSEARAAQWRGWDRQAKADVVIQMIARIWIKRWGARDAGAAWSETLVQQWIDRYDERWGAELAAEEIAIADAIEQLGEEANQHQAVASSPVDAVAEMAEVRHLTRAQVMFRHDLRILLLETGFWSVPSSQLDGTTYECNTQQCSCPRSQRGC